MSDLSHYDHFRGRGCRPHQADFAAHFVRAGSPKHHLLVLPVGSGKSFLAGEIIAYLLEGKLAARVLVVAPAALREQYEVRLREKVGPMPVAGVTRRVFRELEAAVPVGQPPWPTPFVGVISPEHAGQEDINAAILSVKWDLVVIDEAHGMAGPQRRSLLGRLAEGGAARLLLMSGLRPSAEVLAVVPDLAVTQVPPPEVRSDLAAPHPDLKFIRLRFQRGEDEQALVDDLRTAGPALQRATGSKWVHELLMRRAESSIFALERSLQRLESAFRQPLKDVRHELALLGNQDDVEIEAAADAPPMEVGEIGRIGRDDQAARLEVALSVIGRLLDGIDRVVTDRKGEKLVAFLESAAYRSSEERWTCVTTEFAETARYVASVLEDAGHKAIVATSDATPEERERSWSHFDALGGIIIMTAAAADWFPLAKITLLLHFDPPRTASAAERWVGRLQRVSRTAPCTIAVLEEDGSPATDVTPERIIDKEPDVL